jgi:hypothetical protein
VQAKETDAWSNLIKFKHFPNRGSQSEGIELKSSELPALFRKVMGTLQVSKNNKSVGIHFIVASGCHDKA